MRYVDDEEFDNLDLPPPPIYEDEFNPLPEFLPPPPPPITLPPFPIYEDVDITKISFPQTPPPPFPTHLRPQQNFDWKYSNIFDRQSSPPQSPVLPRQTYSQRTPQEYSYVFDSPISSPPLSPQSRSPEYSPPLSPRSLSPSPPSSPESRSPEYSPPRPRVFPRMYTRRPPPTSYSSPPPMFPRFRSSPTQPRFTPTPMRYGFIPPQPPRARTRTYPAPPPSSYYTSTSPPYMSSDERFLRSLGITDRTSWVTWLKKNHPDKGGNQTLELTKRVITAYKNLNS